MEDTASFAGPTRPGHEDASARGLGVLARPESVGAHVSGGMMRAAMIHSAGAPEVLRIERIPIPQPRAGEVLIQVKAFGLNRSELFTRQGHSSGVVFPRVLGIEATGVVAEAPGGEFAQGTIVATAMGGMGRQFDGGYAEYTLVPVSQVQTIATRLPWATLGAMPEMLQTAWGSLFRALRLEPGERLLIRGGTSSIGLAAALLAKQHGAFVGASTRRAERAPLLRENGVDQVFIDSGVLAGQVRDVCAGGFHKVLELVGTTTLLDSLQCAAPRGVVCMTGMVGDAWAVREFSPMAAIPTSVCLTTYAGGAEDFMMTPMDALAEQVARGELRLPIGQIFRLDDIVAAHRCMESNLGEGKIVVLP